MRDCHLWNPTQAPSGGDPVWEQLCLVRLWISSPWGLPQQQSGVWVHLPLWVPREGFRTFSHEVWESAPAGITAGRNASQWRTSTPCLLSWNALNSCSGLLRSTWSTRGRYEHPVMPFGLCNARAIFQYSVNAVLRDLLHSYTTVYLDDILVFCTSQEAHVNSIQVVFHHLHQCWFCDKLKKFSFHQQRVEFMG